MAYWFMDDGGKMDYTKNGGKGVVFNTQGFEWKEVEEMSKELGEKFGLITWVGENKKRPVIKVSGKSYERFMELVEENIIPSMKKKLPSKRKLKT